MKYILLFLTLVSPLAAEKTIHAYVCLCDNVHQGILPVGEKIGNGMKPASNLYWGCSDGLSSYFKKSKKWKLTKRIQPKDSPILDQLHFTHHTGKAKLIASAYRGDRMEDCLNHFLTRCREAGKNELVAFIGHNGLMDSSPQIPSPAKHDDVAANAIVLACQTQSYFTEKLKKLNARPLLLTRSNMYPGSFLLHDAAEVWLRNGSRDQIRQAAAKAYARNQKISQKSALTVFAKID